MPILLPFRAFRSSPLQIHIPGEDPVSTFGDAFMVQDAEPALFIYRQRFHFPGEVTESSREGVMGLLNRTDATVFPHEQTVPNGVAACREMLQSNDRDPGSLWLWCGDAEHALRPLLHVTRPPDIQATDRFGCLHEIWSVTDPDSIRDLQTALAGQDLFLADGHHRFAAGWSLATIQVRSAGLRTLPSHRIVFEAGQAPLPSTHPVDDVDLYLTSAPEGYSRFVAVTKGPVFNGIETPRGTTIENTTIESLIGNSIARPTRERAYAIAAVESGQAQMALLVAPVSIADIEHEARRGILRPPKSTDFFPKLAAGLVIHRSSE